MNTPPVIRSAGRTGAARLREIAAALLASCALTFACSGATRSKCDATPPAADATAFVNGAMDSTPSPSLGETPALQSNAPTVFIMESSGSTYAVHTNGETTPIMRFPPGLAEDPVAYLHLYAVSPDGRAVAAGCADDRAVARIPPLGTAARICVFRGGDPMGRVVVTNANFIRGGEISSPWPNSDPFVWSPDGTKIVFYVRIDGSASDVYVANLTSGSVRRVFENSGYASLTGATWSPDGKHFTIAPFFDEPSSASVLVVDSDSGGQIDLTRTLPFEVGATTSVTWSSDGASVAFIARRRKPGGTDDPYDRQIYVAHADGSNGHRVATAGLAPEYESPMAWSPDDRWLVASLVMGRDPDSVAPIHAAYLLRVDGGDQRLLGQGISSFGVAWAPDGKRLALWARGTEGYTFAIASIDGDLPARFVDVVLAPLTGPMSLYPVVSAWNLDQTMIFYSIRGCWQAGCAPGPLFATDAAGGAPRKLWDKDVERLIEYAHDRN